MTLKLTDGQPIRLVERGPEIGRNLKGDRPSQNLWRLAHRIFWILAEDVNWKRLPERLGSRSTGRRWPSRCVSDGVWESVREDARRRVEQSDGCGLSECRIHGTFKRSAGGGEDNGCAKAGQH